MSKLMAIIAMISSLGHAGDNVDRKQVMCLAENVYFESRGEPVLGQAAVAWVTLNRARLDGKSICDTVHARFQFSWTIGGGPAKVEDPAAWKSAVEVSVFSMVGYVSDPTMGSTHYYNPDKVTAKPNWAYGYEFAGAIGRHVFYKDSNRGSAVQVASIESLIMRVSSK